MLRFEWDDRKSQANGYSRDFRSQRDGEGAYRLQPTGKAMKKEYDFSQMKGRANPYAKRLKKQVTIRLGVDVLEYFKALAKETGIPYQNLINLYLRDCAVTGKRPTLKWATSDR